MISLGLDLSTHIGYAVVDSEKGLSDYGVVHLDREPVSGYEKLATEYTLMLKADQAQSVISDLINRTKPNLIVIEQVNLGRSRETQKLLDWIHYSAINATIGPDRKPLQVAYNVIYVDSSAWRSKLGIKLSKDQRKHNKLVKNKYAKGKITFKHLSVEWANNMFGLSLKLKDNDSADAIALAVYGTIKTGDIKIKPFCIKEALNEL